MLRLTEKRNLITFEADVNLATIPSSAPGHGSAELCDENVKTR
jgi:hypothetical protein